MCLLESLTSNLKKLTGKTLHFKFTFDNSIPISRGLGSSSAVIIGAISAAFKVAGIPFQKQEILNLALNYESHPDNITPACMGGFNVCMLTQRKNEVRFIHSPLPDSIQAVVVIPNQSISTHLSRQTLPKNIAKKMLCLIFLTQVCWQVLLSRNILNYCAKQVWIDSINIIV